jgi:diacylglycerol kinase (ATP)
MRHLIIVNPTAGNGRAGRIAPRVLDALKKAGADVEIARTASPGDARHFGATTDCERVVVVGGDGTVHEVASGMLESGRDAALGVVGAGSGNDFSRALGMPRTIADMCDVFVSAVPRPIDYGRLRWRSREKSGESIFVNAVGCGFDAFVAHRSRRMRMLRGYPRYLVTVLTSLAQWRNPVGTIQAGSFSWSGPMLLCTLGNGISSGGGFLLTPTARLDDGRLDLCVAHAMTIPRLLQILPRALRGTHIGQAEISYEEVSSAKITLEFGVPVHVDGEIVAPDILEMEVEVISEGLKVLAPMRLR